MSKMRVAMVTGEFLPHIGGVETHIDQVSRILMDRVDLTVICARQGEIDLPYKVIRDYGHNLDEFDIVHFHDYSHYRNVHVPNYITFHGYEGQCPPRRDAIHDRQLISRLVCGTIHVGDYLHKWYGTGHYNNFTIFGGCTIPKYTVMPREMSKDKVIGYVGRISEDKRTDIYQKAMLLLPDYKLEIASDIPHEKIEEFWKDKDIAFCNGQLSMLEAMSQGLPCIALASNDMVSDMLDQSAALTVDTEDQIARRVKMLEEKNHYHNWSLNSWQFANKNTWHDVAETYLKLWRIY